MKKLLLLTMICAAVSSCAPTAGISSFSGLSMMTLEAIEAQRLTENGKKLLILEIKEELRNDK